MSPTIRALSSNLTRIMLASVALLIGLNVVDIDLTAFTVFSGAVGVGVGFGLQKIVSNFASGIILLLERSIKPGILRQNHIEIPFPQRDLRIIRDPPQRGAGAMSANDPKL